MCQTALKEWASVLMAMERGEQCVLIRKGGLMEPGSGFDVLSKTVVFYPTFEHQTVNFLREPYRVYLEEARARRADGQHVRFELCGQVVASAPHTDAAVIERLQPFHVYNGAFATQRLKWQPEQPLVIAVVRAFRFPQPCLVPADSRYAGCKSWVDLGEAVSLEGATPVLSDDAFTERLTVIRNLLGWPQGLTPPPL